VAAPTLKDAWRRGQQGWPASFPIVQFPNAPLLIAFAASIIASATNGSVHEYARAASYLGLGVWAWLELTDGVNWFRRVLGAAGLVYVVAEIGSAFGA